MGDVESRSKWTKNPTSTEVQSKRSRNSSSVNVSDVRTHIDLNADTNEISDGIEKISHPRRLVGRDTMKRFQRHANEVEKRATYSGNQSEVRCTRFTSKRKN